jgi:hypothetical protein
MPMSEPATSAEHVVSLEGEELPSPRAVRRGLGGVGLWMRVGLAVALLAASAAGRVWQARRVDQMLRDGRVAPFRVNEIPLTLGPWVGEDAVMDPIIARATGATERLNRIYRNLTTGQRVSVIVLFGPSSEMFVHAPTTCYPASGYECVTGPLSNRVRESAQAEARSWPFYELVYRKGEGGQADQQDVFYTWRYSGQWSPGLTTPKWIERIPGMFKVQVSRPVKDAEIDLLSVGNPCESFLAHLMPEIDRRIAESQSH